MKNLITEIRSYKITINNCDNKCATYELPYHIRQLEKLNINSKKANQLRKSGVRVITKKRYEDNKIIKDYYKVYAVWNKNYNYRIKLVEMILYKKLNIESQNNIIDKYGEVLDILSSYLMCDPKLANLNNSSSIKTKNINKALRDIDKNKINKTKHSKIKKMEKRDFSHWKKHNFSQQKKWIKSKTYKINKLFSYNLNNYISQWCSVLSDNTFKFDGSTYRIDNRVKDYRVRSDNEALMDQVLAIKNGDNLNFYNQNIFKINNKFIKQI